MSVDPLIVLVLAVVIQRLLTAVLLIAGSKLVLTR